jgi:hypothetical protein
MPDPFLRLRGKTIFSGVNLFGNDPLLATLSRIPYSAAFLVLLVFGLGIPAALSAASGTLILSDPGPTRFGYFQDFLQIAIWGLIIPAGLVLLIRYFRMVPRTFDKLVNGGVLSADSGRIARLFAKSRFVFEARWLSAAVFAIAAALIAVAQFKNLPNLREKGFQTWMVADGHYTIVHLYTYALIAVLDVSLGVSVLKFTAVILFLFRLFQSDRAPEEGKTSPETGGGDCGIHIRVLHPDGAGGLRPLGDLCLALNLFIFMVGLIVALVVAKKVVLEGTSLASFSILVQVGLYVLLAPLIFFLPMWSLHSRMKAAKESMLEKLTSTFNVRYNAIVGALAQDRGPSPEAAEELERIEKLYRHATNMPVWPFDLRNLSLFFGTVAFPVALALGAETIASIIANIVVR